MVSYWFRDSAIAQGIEAAFVVLVVVTAQGVQVPPSSIIFTGLGVMLLVGAVRSMGGNAGKDVGDVRRRVDKWF